MESLRVLPPVPLTVRKAHKTDFLAGHLVPKGTFLHIPVRRPVHSRLRERRLISSPSQIRVINTWQAVWGPDAEECVPYAFVYLRTGTHDSPPSSFRPSRWLDLPKTYNPAFSFMSFIAGPHGCIGKTMALIEMKAVLV